MSRIGLLIRLGSEIKLLISARIRLSCELAGEGSSKRSSIRWGSIPKPLGGSEIKYLLKCPAERANEYAREKPAFVQSEAPKTIAIVLARSSNRNMVLYYFSLLMSFIMR